MGPTAVGKTDLAVALATSAGAEVFSADSRQFYQELNIGVARPAESQLKAVNHHFMACQSIVQPYTAMQYAQACRLALEKYFEHSRVAVLVGGSGLYIKALIEGIDELPGVDPAIRHEVRAFLELHGLEKMVDWLGQLDPLSLANLDLKNPRRVVRAVEVCVQTGEPYSSFLTGAAWIPPFDVLGVEVMLDRAALYARIDQRVERMMEQGLLKEVSSLLPYAHLPVLQTVGYSELFAYLRGELELEKAVELIKQHTRNYAKRQITWLRNQAWHHQRIQINGADISPSIIEQILATQFRPLA